MNRIGSVARPRQQLRTLLALFILIASFTVLAVAAAQQGGGVLRVGTSVEPPTLDPQRDAGGPASEVQENIFETLVAFDNDMNLVPLLAESWEVSDDGTIYTFTLRNGVEFHDGTSMNAEAVKFSFDRALGRVDEKTSRYATLLTQLDDVEVIDEHTVAFHLNDTFAPFLNNLAHLGNAILSPTAVEEQGEDFGHSPIGTGPFRFESWNTGQQIRLVRNDDYWREPAELGGVTFRYIPDASTRLVSLESREIDVALAVPESDFERLSQVPGIETYKADTLRTVYLWFNPNMPPFDDIAVREAVVKAIDREGIAAAILEGLHRPATRPVFAPGVFGVSDDVTPYLYDPEAAVQTLQEAGWEMGRTGVRVKDGKPLQFTLYTTQNRYPKDGEIGAYLRDVLGRTLGANVELATFEWETYRNKIFAKEFGLFLFGAGVSTGDIDYVMTIIFHSSSRYSQVPVPLEEQIIEAQTIVDEQERLALYKEIQESIGQEYLWMPIYWQSALHASSDDVQGFAPHPMEKVTFYGVSLQ
jgi:peptide/nickel transport system substrate-binding protein